jgi:hypothetical protein
VAAPVCVVACAACGSSAQHVDSGGFTDAQRKAAQTALDRLPQTMIPRTVLAISYQAGQAPRICTVLPQPDDPSTFKLYLAWRPTRPGYKSVPQSLLVATISEASAAKDHYHVSTFGGQGRGPIPASIEASLTRVAEASPAEQCEVLDNGHLQIAATS